MSANFLFSYQIIMLFFFGCFLIFVNFFSDVKKARLLLKSVRETNPKHPPGMFSYYVEFQHRILYLNNTCLM